MPRSSALCLLSASLSLRFIPVRFVAHFKVSADIIPIDEPEPEEGYVTVTFDKGTGKSLTGTSKFHVKKDVVIDLTTHAPVAVPQDGYKFIGWNSSLNQAFGANTTITAQY